MNVQRESSPYSSQLTIATVTKVKSKMAPSIKLKVLSFSDTTRIQSSRKFLRQIFINRQQLLNLGGEWNRTQNWSPGRKLTGSKNFQMTHSSFLRLKWLKPHMKICNMRLCSREAPSCAVWRDRQLVVQSCSVHTAHVFQECGCDSSQFTGVNSVITPGKKLTVCERNRITDSNTGLTTVFCCCVNVARMISEGSCDTEDCSNDAVNVVLITGIYYILKHFKLKNCYFKINISKSSCFNYFLTP